MKPSLWGADIWRAMHLIAAGYPTNPTIKNKKEYKKLYTALGHTLPCGMCAKSYRHYMKELKIDNYLVSKKKLMYWVYLIHNRVNKKLKKNCKKSFKTVCKSYMKLLKR